MGKALYRSYRSRSFDEVIGQEHITTTLKNALKNNAIAHAYLLTGPRGVGKTSIARILAFAVNDIDYDQDTTHLDIIEIDAASNRRIDEIRDIREKVHIAPTSGKYKIYIIDEVHMLTREAFNALLKTLEEPPEHVIFILATTEAHKVPETIVSRCIRFTFKPISQADIAKHLTQIAKNERIEIGKDALELLASHGNGSFRDGITLLEQVKHTGSKVEVKDVEKMLGIAPGNVITSILSALGQGNPGELDKTLANTYEFGVNESALAVQIAQEIRAGLLSGKSQLNKDQSIRLLRSLLGVAGSPRPRSELELALFDILLEQSPAMDAPINETHEEIDPEIEEPPLQAIPEPDLLPISEVDVDVPPEPNTDAWQATLANLKTKNSTLYGIARMANVEQSEDTLKLTFRFPFHYKQMNESKNRAILTEVIKVVSGDKITVEITQSTPENLPPASNVKKTDDELESVTNIFGSTEVLES